MTVALLVVSVVLEASTLLALLALVRRAPVDPAWSDLRGPDARAVRFFEGAGRPDTPGPSVSPPGGRVPSESDENTTESDES